MRRERAELRRGVALVSTLAFLAVIVIFVSVAVTVALSNNRLSGDSFRTYQAQLAADAGLQRVIAESWFRSYEENENEAVPDDYQLTLETFRTQLDETGILAGSKTTNGYSFGDETIYTQDLEGVSYETSVRRVDVGESYTLLRIDSSGFVGDAATSIATRRMSADLRVQVPQADSQGFAVLGNNANCLFCHTQLSTLEAAYDNDNKLVNLFSLDTPKKREDTLKDKQRVKVALLENLLTDRASDMESLITGTIYTRASSNVAVQGGSLAAIPLQTIDKQSTSRLSGNEAKALTELDAVNCANLCEKRHALFYKNYPSGGADGAVPETFPLLLEDTNNNRQIEHSEWQAAVALDAGGQLTGGVKGIVTTKTVGEWGLEPSSTTLKHVANLATAESVDGVRGNVILEGTANNPLVITGTLYINGDVIISGAITGDGKIVARGNVYITGNVTYACDDDSTDTKWHASQSTTCTYNESDTLPRLGVVAGKNILVGAYMTPASSAKIQGQPSDQLTRLNFAETSEEELASWFIDAGQALDNPQTLSYTMTQMALFNEHEYRKAKATNSYVPRFYKLRDEGQVFRCAKGFSATKEDYCKNYSELTNLSLSTDTSDLALLARAMMVSATPTNAWLGEDATSSELEIRNMWVNNIEALNNANALHLDGLYYTPNAIFGNLPSRSATEGNLLLNGSLAAADIALLAPSGITINHDQRLAEMLGLNQTNTVIQTISNYRLLDADAVVDYGAIQP